MSDDIFGRLDLLGQHIGHVITQLQFQKISKRTDVHRPMPDNRHVMFGQSTATARQRTYLCRRFVATTDFLVKILGPVLSLTGRNYIFIWYVD